MILGHIDHNPDPILLEELAARGAYLAFDTPGRTKYCPDSRPAQLIATLADRGSTDQILLAADLARRSYWPSLGGGPGLDYLLQRFVPRLKAMGLENVARQALERNPSRALRLRQGASPSKACFGGGERI